MAEHQQPAPAETPEEGTAAPSSSRKEILKEILAGIETLSNHAADPHEIITIQSLFERFSSELADEDVAKDKLAAYEGETEEQLSAFISELELLSEQQQAESAGTVEALISFLQKAVAAAQMRPVSAANTQSSGPMLSEASSRGLMSMTAHEYLKETVAPVLLPALMLVENMRPPNPLQFLAVHLLKVATEKSQPKQVPLKRQVTTAAKKLPTATAATGESSNNDPAAPTASSSTEEPAALATE